MQAGEPHPAVRRHVDAIRQRHAGDTLIHRQPVHGQAPVHQLAHHAVKRQAHFLFGAARWQAVGAEGLAGAVEAADLIGQRQGEPNVVVGIDAHRVRVQTVVEVVSGEGLAHRVELEQTLLQRRGDEDVAVLRRLGEGVDAGGGFQLRIGLQAAAEQPTDLVTLVHRRFVHHGLAGFRVDFPQAVLQIVTDINLAVAVQQQVMHLREGVTNRPLAHLGVGQLALPGLGTQDFLRVLAQVGVALLEHLDQFRLVLAGRPRAVADHAFHDLLPFLLATLAAHKETALLVAEAALLHGGFLQRLVTAKIQGGEPGVGRLLGGEGGGIGLGLEAQL